MNQTTRRFHAHDNSRDTKQTPFDTIREKTNERSHCKEGELVCARKFLHLISVLTLTEMLWEESILTPAPRRHNPFPATTARVSHTKREGRGRITDNDDDDEYVVVVVVLV